MKLKILCVILAVLVLLLAASSVWLAVSRADIQKECEQISKDYKLYRNIISQDEVEQTLFGQPISP